MFFVGDMHPLSVFLTTGSGCCFLAFCDCNIFEQVLGFLFWKYPCIGLFGDIFFCLFP